MTDDPFAFHPVARTFHLPKKAIVIADAIAEDILARNLPPGTPLAKEAEMLSEFGVGRATLREGLRLLEAEGLIVVRAGSNGGAVVGRPSLDRLARLLSMMFALSGTTIGEVVAARRLFEPELCALAAENADAEDVARLESLIEQSREAIDDPRRSVELSAEFHTAVAIAGKNRALAAFWLTSSSILSQQVGVGYHRADLQDALRAHEAICTAISKGARQQARSAMTKHMEAVFDYLEQRHGDQLGDAVRFLGAQISPR
jgi:GntR family transcriptional regulator, transcriptional repressor for pyruvate dehydrogenase complex